MAAFGGALGQASFNEPQSSDTTSAPQVQIPQGSQGPTQPPQQQSLAQALAKRKKGTAGPTMRPPSTLAAAISRSKRARPSADKYG
jgi:hypothetical protein